MRPRADITEPQFDARSIPDGGSRRTQPRRWIIAALVVAASVWVIALADILSLNTVTILGTISVASAPGSRGACAVPTPGAVGVGTVVTIRDPGNKIIGATTLRAGRAAKSPRRCVYNFRVRDVPSGFRTYGVEVGDRGPVHLLSGVHITHSVDISIR